MDPANGVEWDRFWQAGRTSCCSDHDGSANARIIHALWSGFFASLGNGERLLDLCTGNGAVVNAALDSAGNNGICIMACGVDSACIAPTVACDRQRGGDPFFVRASITALPFEDGCFDALASQFGIEYAPPEQAVAESLRVLGNNGRGLFVTHAGSGVTIANARAELADIDELENEIRLFPAALAALPLVCAVERATRAASSRKLATARAAHADFQERLKRVGTDWQKRAARAVFRDTGDILQHTYRNRHAFPVGVLLDKVRETERSVTEHRARLQALVDAALEQQDCERLVSAYRRRGVSACEFSPVIAEDSAGQLAWAITLRR